MKCVFCKEGMTRSKRVTVERHNQAGEPVAVIHNFPAQVCKVCGEEYYRADDWERADQLLKKSPVKIARVPVRNCVLKNCVIVRELKQYVEGQYFSLYRLDLVI